jgi:prephenate dehydratase
VAEAGDLTRAALAPAGAAEVYGLTILRNDLQDSPENRTRFVLIGAPKA